MNFWDKKRQAAHSGPANSLDAGHELARASSQDAPERAPAAPRVFPKGVAEAALAGAPLLEVLREALAELRAAGGAERLGIWMAALGEPAGSALAEKSPAPREAPHEGEAAPADSAWRGVAWDRENEATPREWHQLSGEAPIPQDVLRGARAVTEELTATGNSILISILVGMRRALWTPISVRGRILGVILCATRERSQFPEAAASRLAAELALQLAWREERQLARERYADLAFARRTLAAEDQPDAVLAGLADSLVSGAHSDTAADGLHASFAAIGVLAAVPSADSAPAVDFRWKSGDPDWLRLAEGHTFASTWQEALRSRRTTGMQPQNSWMHTRVARVVALPISAEGQLCGVLLAGLPRPDASLATLERLELRATLAGLAIARQKRDRAAALAARLQRAHLAASRELLFVVDPAGTLLELSASAAELLRESAATPKPQDLRTPSIETTFVEPTFVEPSLVETKFVESKFVEPNSVEAPFVEPTGKPFAQIFRPADRSAVAAFLAQARGTDAPQPLAPSVAGHWNAAALPEFQAQLPSGLRLHLRQGLPTAAAHTLVTAQPLASHAPASPSSDIEQTLQGVIEWLEEGVVLFDSQGHVRASNTRFAQFAGLPPGESAKGHTLEALLQRMQTQAAEPAAFAERWRALARASEGGVRDELRMLLPTPRILERASRPVLDSAARPLGRVEIYRDLTAQRVFQSQLLQTEKLAALGQMITGVAHELSNPLTSILGYAQRLLLREDALASATEVRQIFQEAERAAGILRQLLFSARESPPERRRVALNQVVLRSMELQRFSIAAEKIRFELDLDPALPVILGDAAQLQQVLMNLVGNARQAILQHGHGGCIRVRTRQAPGRRVQLFVEDDGPGVPQSILARIFDPFFTTKAAGVGTGLGLSIVLSIVREHGGSVNVLRSAEGGAIFSIELPVAEGLAVTPALAPPAAAKSRVPFAAEPSSSPLAAMARTASPALSAPSPPPRAHAPSRVLVVEDEPTVARLIADVLHDEGFLVEVLLDGHQALDRTAQQSFDLVICDMKMPGLDGQQFYQRLAERGSPLRHSFLFVTGDVIAPATQAFLERSSLPHLAKPFRVEELTARVRHVLAQGPQPAQPLAPPPGLRENAAGR